MQKVILLDIDKTIIDTDSMQLFVKYSVKKDKKNILRLLPILASTILFQLRLMPIEKTKSIVYKAINDFTDEDIRDFFNNEVMKHQNKLLFDIIEEKKAAGYLIIMISASIESYFKFFEEEYADKVIATKYSKKVIGKNCKSQEKVIRLNREFPIEIDYDNSYAYSDSLTDLPMLELVKNRYQVKYQGKKPYLVDLNPNKI